MQFKSLTIAGAIPFPERTTIDFPEVRKLAVIGDNGAGKSTIFDCVYAAFFGDVTKPNGLYSLFKGSKEGLIDLEFSLNGFNYRIKRLVDGEGRKQKPYLFREGVPLTEGKVAEFDAAIQSILGISERAFLASVYNCQSQKGNPVGLGERERRDLLTEVLGLGMFDEPYEKVCATLSETEKDCIGLRSQKEVLDRGLDPDLLETHRKQLETKVLELDRGIQGKEEAIQHLRQQLANAQANAQQLEEVKRQVLSLEQQIATDQKIIGEIEAKIQKNQVELLDKREAILRAVSETERLTKENEALDARRQEVCKQGLALQELQKAEIQEKQLAVDTATARLAEVQQGIRGIETQRASLLSRAESLKAVNRSQEGNVQVLGQVPCQPTPEYHGTCPLLANAKSAKKTLGDNAESIKAIEAELESLVVDRSVEVSLAESLTVAREALRQAQAVTAGSEQWKEADELSATIKRNSAGIQAMAPLVKNAPYLQDAESRMDQYQREIEGIQQRAQGNQTALVDWKGRLNQAQDLLKTLHSLNAEIELAEREKRMVTTERDQAMGQIGQLQSQIAQALENRAKSLKIEVELTDKLKRVSLLQFLKEGLGPKGARALKIDSAGPEIGEMANALMAECFGPRFSVIVKTLREIQSGEQREALEFSILDNETGEETAVENKSGGEQQLIREVIALALTIYQRRRAGVDLRTLLRDEPCSALTEENSVRYIQMLDKALSLAGADHLFYIDHKSAAQELADGVIEVIKGGKVKVRAG